MVEKTGGSVDLGSEAISFRVIVAEPGKKGWSIKYGPYNGWLHATFDVGQVIGYAQGKGTPTSWLRVEWFIGDKLIETKDLGDGPGEGTGQGSSEDPGGGQVEAGRAGSADPS